MNKIGFVKTFFCVLCAIISLAFISCDRNAVYSEVRDVDEDGWNKDSVVEFTYNAEDIDADDYFTVSLLVRHSGTYPNQNLWLFVDKIMPDSTCVKDTTELFLADDFGRWRGSGIGSLYTMESVLTDSVKFDKAGKYIYRVRHGMRYDELNGICNIGVLIRRMTAE